MAKKPNFWEKLSAALKKHGKWTGVISVIEAIQFIVSLSGVLLNIVSLLSKYSDPWSSTFEVKFIVAFIVFIIVLCLAFSNILQGIALRRRSDPEYKHHILLFFWMAVCMSVFVFTYQRPIGILLHKWQGYETIAFVSDSPVEPVYSDLEDAIHNSLKVKVDFITLSNPLPSFAANGETALENFRKNNWYKAVFLIHSVNPVDPKKRSIEITEPIVNGDFSSTNNTFDEAYQGQFVILQYLSLMECNTGIFQNVITLAKNWEWAKEHSAEWSEMVEDHSAYLVCFLQSAYMLQDMEMPYRLGPSLVDTMNRLWYARDMFPEAKPVISLIYAQLLFDNGKFDQVENEVFAPNQLEPMNSSQKADAYKILGEILLTRSYLEPDNIKNTLINQAIDKFDLSIKLNGNSSSSYFGLGRAHFLLSLMDTHPNSSQDLVEAITNLATASQKSNLSCLKRNILMWLSASYAIKGDASLADETYSAAKKQTCRSSTTLVNLGTPLTVSNEDLQNTRDLHVILSLPETSDKYLVEIIDGAHNSLQSALVKTSASIYEFTLDITTLLSPPFQFVYYELSGQLEIQKNYQLAVITMPGGLLQSPTFPFRVIAPAYLVVESNPNLGPDIPQGQKITLTIWIEAGFDQTNAQVLTDPQILERFSFHIRIGDPPIDEVAVRIPGTQQFRAQHLFKEGDKTGPIKVKAVVMDDYLRSEILSKDLSFNVLTPTPIPTPTSTPNLNEEWVASIIKPIYLEKDLQSNTLNIKEDCPIVFLDGDDLSQTPTTTLQWYKVKYASQTVILSGWIPQDALVGYAKIPVYEFSNMAVAIKDTQLYETADVASGAPPIMPIPKCTLLATFKETEAACSLNVYLPKAVGLIQGWIPCADIEKRKMISP